MRFVVWPEDIGARQKLSGAFPGPPGAGRSPISGRHMGFRFEAIRALFPWLAPVIDQMGSAVLSAGGEFLKASFGWLKKIAGDVVTWLGRAAMDTLSNPSLMPETPGGPSILDPGWMLDPLSRKLGHQGA